MEVKKHNQAKKKLTNAVATFVGASHEVNQAMDLIDQSITDDKKQIEKFENQIQSLLGAIDQVQANILSKQGEYSSYKSLADKLESFIV